MIGTSIAIVGGVRKRVVGGGKNAELKWCRTKCRQEFGLKHNRVAARRVSDGWMVCRWTVSAYISESCQPTSQIFVYYTANTLQYYTTAIRILLLDALGGVFHLGLQMHAAKNGIRASGESQDQLGLRFWPHKADILEYARLLRPETVARLFYSICRLKLKPDLVFIWESSDRETEGSAETPVSAGPAGLVQLYHLDRIYYYS